MGLRRVWGVQGTLEIPGSSASVTTIQQYSFLKVSYVASFLGLGLSFGAQQDLSSVSSGLYIIKPYTPNPGSQIY